MKTRNLVAALSAGVLALVVSGCSNPATDGPSSSGLPESCSADRPAVGVALPDTTNPYYIAMQQGFVDAGAELGFDVKVAIANSSDSTQLSQIESFIQQGVCAVALNAVNSGPAASSVVKLNNAGIPVFTVNVVVDEDALKTQGSTIVQYVGAGAFESGEVMGQQALKDLGADTPLTIGYVGKPDQVQTNLRDEGFTAGISSNPNAEVVATVNGKIDPAVAMQVTQEMLQGNPEINVVWANTGPAAVGALQGIKQLGLAGKVSLYALCADGVPIDDTYRACVAQEPAAYAGIVMENILAYINGDDIESEILLPMVAVTEGLPGEGLFG
ncbi:MAG: substrate-binding domain-containing protein [Microbacterium sp.]